MKKRILSVLLSIAMVVTMLPIINTTVHAADPDYTFDIVGKYHYPQNGSNPETIPFSAFQEGVGDWNSYNSPETSDFTAMFLVFEVEVSIPAYTKVKVNCQPKAEASSINFNISGDFGLELFCFDNKDEWKNLVFKTGTGDDRSSGASLAKSTANTVTATEIELDPSQHYKEFDNSNGEATTRSFYYGVLGYYRETTLKHQLSLGWNFESISPYIDAKYIHYDANGGSGSANTVIAGDYETVTLHSGEGFTKNNSAFVGWYDGSTSYAPGSAYTKEEGAKLRAQYLTYDLNGGSGTVIPGVRGKDGLVIADGEAITKANSAFIGWYDGRTTYIPGSVYTGTNDVDFYAQYLTYDLNGGIGAVIPGVRGKDGLVIADGEAITKANSVFIGWSDGRTTYAPGEVYTKARNVDFYAQYLTYDLSGCSGSVAPGVRGENGLTIASADNIYKVGHTFQNWNTQQNGGGTAYAPGDVYSSRKGLTLYPFFEPNKYDVTPVLDNCAVTFNQNPATYGTAVEITAEPSVGYKLETFEVYRTDDPTVKVPLTGANTFTQPEYPVTVKPILSKIPYAIESLPTENGSFTVSHETAGIDDVVTVTATPNEGFELDTITVTRADSGEPLTVTGNSFTMVPEPVKVAVAFKNSVYDITKAPATNGSFTLNPEHAIMGQTVVVNAVPDEGYQVGSITAYKTGDETVTVEVTDGSFVMPAYPVTVAVEFEPALLAVSKSTGIENGDITISHTEAHLGETVNVSPVGAEGYTLDAITVYKTGDSSVTVTVTRGSFVMPTYPVTVHATFKKIDYTVSVVDDANEKGSFIVDKTTAQIGDTVTVDITCAEGWAVRGITLTNSNGESKLVDKTFTMPASNVTVSVSYMVIPTYVITIPATVELGGAPMTVAITNAVMDEGVSLKVTLETDFTARTAEGAEKTFTINGGSVQNGDVVLMVEGGGTPENPKQGSARLALEWDETYQYSGNYRATLAFTIRVEDEGYNQNE